MPTETLFLVSYSTQSSSDKSTSSNVWPPSLDLTIQAARGENSTGSMPRQSNDTMVLNLPASSAVYTPVFEKIDNDQRCKHLSHPDIYIPLDPSTMSMEFSREHNLHFM